MTTELTIVEKSITRIKQEINLAERMVEEVLTKDFDWGIHPGTTSYALKDPGASKLINSFNCYSDPEILYRESTKEKISFVIKTRLMHRPTGEVKATGVGSCTTTETKYQYRWVADPESYGLDREGLKQKAGKFRIPNPELEELENTILKMATKRAEVDAAQSLPGVGTSLARIFNRGNAAQPAKRTCVTEDWNGFWGQCHALGLDQTKVHVLLGVTSIKDWTAAGHSLNEAIEMLSSKISDSAHEEL